MDDEVGVPLTLLIRRTPPQSRALRSVPAAGRSDGPPSEPLQPPPRLVCSPRRALLQPPLLRGLALRLVTSCPRALELFV